MHEQDHETHRKLALGGGAFPRGIRDNTKSINPNEQQMCAATLGIGQIGTGKLYHGHLSARVSQDVYNSPYTIDSIILFF